MNRSQSKIRHMQQVNVLLEQRKLKLVEQGVVPPSVTTDTTTIKPGSEEGTPIDKIDINGIPVTKEITCSCPELKKYMGKVYQKTSNLTGTFEMIDGDTVKFKAENNILFSLTLNVTD